LDFTNVVDKASLSYAIALLVTTFALSASFKVFAYLTK